MKKIILSMSILTLILSQTSVIAMEIGKGYGESSFSEINAKYNNFQNKFNAWKNQFKLGSKSQRQQLKISIGNLTDEIENYIIDTVQKYHGTSRNHLMEKFQDLANEIRYELYKIG